MICLSYRNLTIDRVKERWGLTGTDGDREGYGSDRGNEGTKKRCSVSRCQLRSFTTRGPGETGRVVLGIWRWVWEYGCWAGELNMFYTRPSCSLNVWLHSLNIQTLTELSGANRSETHATICFYIVCYITLCKAFFNVQQQTTVFYSYQTEDTYF